MTTDIAAFLDRALDEEAETARAAAAARTEKGKRAAAPWVAAGSLLLAAQGDGSHDDVAESVDYQLDAVLEHAARQDPQATLDRVEATKAVVAMHRANRWGNCTTCFDPDTSAAPPGIAVDEAVPWPCPTLRALASAYRRHPDYDQAWLPDGVAVDA